MWMVLRQTHRPLIKGHSTPNRLWEINETNQAYAPVQKETFASLVNAGVYNDRFEHSTNAQEFFTNCIRGALNRFELGDEISILDCGCGPGAWLDVVFQLVRREEKAEVQLYGFDITPEMVNVARERLSNTVPPEHLHTGDILDSSAYHFTQSDQNFEVIYCYDVIQQLPRNLQHVACERMIERLAPGGVAIVFDHDSRSFYGMKMALKKFATRHLGMSLVPSYYCNAHYPTLAHLGAKLGRRSKYSTEIWRAPNGRKRALIVSVDRGE